MKVAKSFTIEADISEYLLNTKGERSASERVNELLRRAMIEEQYELLEAEAARFFSHSQSHSRKGERRVTKAFQQASIRSLARD
jgi:predicted CopG family antitoxin